MKRVKATIEVLVDVTDWCESYSKEFTKKEQLGLVKEQLQDLEILSNNLREYKVISVKETKQQKFKY